MPTESSLRGVLRNMLAYGDLSFRDFVEVALYYPGLGYYARPESPVGREGDYVTSPLLSPVFSFALSRLMDEFMSRSEGEVSTVVDIGCGDGTLINTLYRPDARFFGVDRSLDRVAVAAPGHRGEGDRRPGAAAATRFVQTIEEVPRDGRHLLLMNELYDAFPFARLVKRGEHLHELWVRERDGTLDWSEHEAPPVYDDYFAANGIELQEGQYADVSLEWEAFHADLCRRFERALIVVFDYGFRAPKLFHPRIRRFGTAASYSRQRVTRDLLANPGEQDLTAHLNFSDLERGGERHGYATLFFDVQAKFLLSLGITEHELFTPAQDVSITSAEEGLALIDEREQAKRLIVPDGIGVDIKVLVQGKGVGAGWSFQRGLW